MTVTIVTPLAGRVREWQELSQWYARQTYSHADCSLYLIDTSQDEAFGRMVREWLMACDYASVRYDRLEVGAKGIADMPRGQQIPAVRLAIARIWNHAKRNIGTPFTLSVEDDVIPVDDCITRLMSHMGPNVGGVSAPVRSRFQNHWVVWRNMDGESQPNDLYSERGHGVHEVGGASLGCSLFRSEFVRSCVFRHTGPVPDGDQCIYPQARAKRKGVKFLVDWDAEAWHMAADAYPPQIKPIERRTIEDCPARVSQAGGKLHACAVVGQIIGNDEPILTMVNDDACQACLAGPMPTVHKPGSVVASLALGAIARGRNGWIDAAACDRLQAEMLKHITRIKPEPRPTLVSGGNVVDAIPPLDGRVPYREYRWSVGVITAPRRTPTLGTCLMGLQSAGWESPHIFAEPDTEIPKPYQSLPRTVRQFRQGPWRNYLLGLHEMLARNPVANAFLMLEDDAILPPLPIREYLEQSVLWPNDEWFAALSLYCSSAYHEKQAGWHRFDEGKHGSWMWGALAFVWSRPSLEAFVNNPWVMSHDIRHQNEYGKANADVLIGDWAHREKRSIWFCSPSIAQHVGTTSTVWPSSTADGTRAARSFVKARPECVELGSVIERTDAGGHACQCPSKWLRGCKHLAAAQANGGVTRLYLCGQCSHYEPVSVLTATA